MCRKPMCIIELMYPLEISGSNGCMLSECNKIVFVIFFIARYNMKVDFFLCFVYSPDFLLCLA